MIKAVSLVSILTILVSVSLGTFMITEEEKEQPVLQESVSFIHAHQFWNELPMGTGNQTTINQTGMLKIELSSFFEEDGYVNITIGEYSFQQTTGITHHTISVSEGTEILTLAEGNSSAALGDFYIAKFTLTF